jgi:hypothetical protein
MGFWLHVEVERDRDELPEFFRWCSKPMLYALAHGYDLEDGEPSVLDLVANRLGVDVNPLHKVSGGDLELFFEFVDPNDKEAWAQAEQERLEYERKHESNWQSPSELGTSIRALTNALDSHPGVFEELDVAQYLDGNYYLSGEFRQELEELHQLVAWAEANEIPRIRLLLV